MPHKALKGPIGPFLPYKALKGLITPVTAADIGSPLREAEEVEVKQLCWGSQEDLEAIGTVHTCPLLSNSLYQGLIKALSRPY